MPKVTIGKVEYEIDVPYRARRELTESFQKKDGKVRSIAEQDNTFFSVMMLCFVGKPFRNIDEIIEKISMDEFHAVDKTIRDIIFPSLKDKTDEEKKP